MAQVDASTDGIWGPAGRRRLVSVSGMLADSQADLEAPLAHTRLFDKS
jgi:hypothetical protein